MKYINQKNNTVRLWWQRTFCSILTVCLIGQSAPIIAMQSGETQGDDFLNFLRIQQEEYKRYFDQEALLDGLAYEPEQIIQFVSEKIVYQAYQGVLRGVKGTLTGRAGNSHDQALTLAAMLKDAGMDTEILVGELSSEQVKELNQTIASPQFDELAPPTNSLESTLTNQIIKEAKRIAAEGEDMSSLIEKSEAVTQKILEHISPEQLENGVQSLNEAVANSAHSYRWVRYRLTQGKPWVEVHPAYAGAKQWQLTPKEVEKDKINSKDLQQFSVEVWIENNKGEKHSVTGQWKKPAASLLDHTLSLEINSDAMMQADLWKDPQSLVDASNFFFVQLDGMLPEQGKTFDLRGNIYSGDSISGLNSVFSTINKKTQKVVDTLSGLGVDKNIVTSAEKNQLEKVWLEFTVEKPNGEIRRIERVVFEGNALENTQKAAMELLQRWDIDIATSTPMQQYFQSLKSAQTINAIERLKEFNAYIENNSNPNDEDLFIKYGQVMGNQNHELLTHKRSIFNKFEAANGIVSYLSEPNILAVRHGFDYSNKAWKVYEMTDIVSNQRWSFERNNNTFYPSIENSIKQGVWETQIENARLISQNNSTYSDSAFKALSQSETYTVKLGQESADIKLVNESSSAWWDVDLQTGRTVGMIMSEFGVGGAELTNAALLNYMAFGISGAFAAVGTIICADDGNSAACCLVSNGAIALAGMAFGWVLGAVKLFSSLALSSTGIAVDFASTYISVCNF